MEHGDSFIHYGHHIKPLSGSNRVPPTSSYPNKGTPSLSNSNNEGPVPNLAKRDKDNISIANVTKIMRQVLPSTAKISNDAKVMIQQCAFKYICFLTQKANEICQTEYRSTLKPEDLLRAMGDLGFDDYVEPLTAFLHRYHHIKGDSMTHHKEPIPVSVSQSLNNDELGSGLVPSIEMLQPTLQQPLASFGSEFSIDSSTNLGMFDPMDMNKFFGDG